MTPVLIPRHTGLWSFNGPFILVTTIPEAAPSLSLPPVLLYRNQSSFKKSILCQETAVQSLLIVGQGGGVEVMQEQDWRLSMREGHLEGWWWKTQPIKNRLWSHIKGKQWRAVCRAGCFPPTSMIYFCTAFFTQHLFFPLRNPCLYSFSISAISSSLPRVLN